MLHVVEGAADAEAPVNPAASVPNEPLGRLAVGKAIDLAPPEGGSPQVAADQVGDQLEVADVPGSECGRNFQLEILICLEIETPDAGPTFTETTSGSVKCDFVAIAGELQEGDTVPVPERFSPPLQVKAEGRVKRDIADAHCTAQSVQHAGHKEPPGSDHF